MNKHCNVHAYDSLLLNTCTKVQFLNFFMACFKVYGIFMNEHFDVCMTVYFLTQHFSFWISSGHALNFRVHGISRPPWGRSAEYLLLSVTIQCILPPLLKNNEQSLDIFRGKCPMTLPPFTTATAYLSFSSVGSLSHSSSSPTVASQMCLYTWYPRTQQLRS